MSGTDVSSNEVNDAIIRLFLYGSEDAPDSFADEDLIRPADAETNYHVEAADYKDGPGRFAMPELFEIVREFFDLDYGYLLDLTVDDGNYGDSLLNPQTPSIQI